MRWISLLLAIKLVALTVDGQTAYERFLLPLYGPPAAGAYGSLWGVESWVHYAGTEDTDVVPRLTVCTITCTPFYPLLAGEGPVRIQAAYGGSSLLLHVDRRVVSDFHFSSRVRDLSRADGRGAEVPVIHESRMYASPVYLLNVPLHAGSRNTLRVYALPEIPDPVVEVRFFRMPRPDADLVPDLRRVDRITLRTPPGVDGFQIRPSASVYDFQVPELQAEGTVWLEIVPLTPGLRIWAMVSVTDNTTQHVTLVTPSRR